MALLSNSVLDLMIVVTSRDVGQLKPWEEQHRHPDVSSWQVITETRSRPIPEGSFPEHVFSSLSYAIRCTIVFAEVPSCVSSYRCRLSSRSGSVTSEVGSCVFDGTPTVCWTLNPSFVSPGRIGGRCKQSTRFHISVTRGDAVSILEVLSPEAYVYARQPSVSHPLHRDDVVYAGPSCMFSMLRKRGRHKTDQLDGTRSARADKRTSTDVTRSGDSGAAKRRAASSPSENSSPDEPPRDAVVRCPERLPSAWPHPSGTVPSDISTSPTRHATTQPRFGPAQGKKGSGGDPIPCGLALMLPNGELFSNALGHSAERQQLAAAAAAAAAAASAASSAAAAAAMMWTERSRAHEPVAGPSQGAATAPLEPAAHPPSSTRALHEIALAEPPQCPAHAALGAGHGTPHIGHPAAHAVHAPHGGGLSLPPISPIGPPEAHARCVRGTASGFEGMGADLMWWEGCDAHAAVADCWDGIGVHDMSLRHLACDTVSPSTCDIIGPPLPHPIDAGNDAATV